MEHIHRLLVRVIGVEKQDIKYISVTPRKEENRM